MSQYKISAEEIASFARKVYEEGSYGYLDLKEATCDRMVREFLADRAMLTSSEFLNEMASNGTITTAPATNTNVWMGGGSIQLDGITVPSVIEVSLDPAPQEHSISVQTSTGHTIQMTDVPDDARAFFDEGAEASGIALQLRTETLVREESVVRDETTIIAERLSNG